MMKASLPRGFLFGDAMTIHKFPGSDSITAAVSWRECRRLMKPRLLAEGLSETRVTEALEFIRPVYEILVELQIDRLRKFSIDSSCKVNDPDDINREIRRTMEEYGKFAAEEVMGATQEIMNYLLMKAL